MTGRLASTANKSHGLFHLFIFQIFEIVLVVIPNLSDSKMCVYLGGGGVMTRSPVRSPYGKLQEPF